MPRGEALQAAWTARWNAHGVALADLARRGGWTLVTHSTDHRAVEAALALHASLGGDHHALPAATLRGETA